MNEPDRETVRKLLVSQPSGLSLNWAVALSLATAVMLFFMVYLALGDF